MAAPFPLTPSPAYYTQTAPTAAHGIWYVGNTPSFTLSKSGSTNYSVRDYYGNVVSSGSVSGTSVTPTVPNGGWLPGWYRMYLTGASTDSLFGVSYGCSTFVILRSDSRFPTAVTGGLNGSNPRDLRTKAALGMGTSRLEIPNIGSPDYTGLHADTDSSNAYWSVSSGAYYDAARPRQTWVNFPNDATSNLSGVTSIVSDMYPRGVTRYEGPVNEPTLNAAYVTKMQQFYNAVKAGNSSAIVIGPSPVAIDAAPGGGLEQFLAAGGGNYIDEWAVHAYNSQTNGDINLARAQWATFKALLAKYGQSSKLLWNTESVNTLFSVYGVYHPRRSRIPLLMTLLSEQIGIPRERNNYWYDISHGFWSFPGWWEHIDGSLNPLTVLYRVLAEETFGMVHSAALTFGAVGDKVFIGSQYTGSAGSVIVVQSQSALPNATVTFTVLGATSLTAVDGLGNSTTINAINGRVTLPVGDIPAYLRIPNGVTATVHHCNDWPVNTTAWVSNAIGSRATTGAGALVLSATDGKWPVQYTENPIADGTYVGTTVPDTFNLTWPTAARIDRVLIWGGAWQNLSSLVDFDVQTTLDGTNWITQSTVTKPAPVSFKFGSDDNGPGCQYETYWDEQWIFDVKLASPIVVKAIRLVVRASSYGGEPDAQAVAAGGQGGSAQHLTIQELVTVCDDNANTPRLVRG